MGTGGLAARSWLEDDESSRLDVWRSSRHFHLLQVLALGCFSPHHKPIGHEGALHVPGHDSRRPVSYPVGIRRTPVALWAAGCLHRDTNKKNKRPFTPPPGRAFPSAPASGHVLPTALVAPPAHYGRTAAAARSMVDRGLDTHLGMGEGSASGHP